MPQLVFIHGPGAGGCADAYYYQRRHFPGSVAPNLPGHLEGAPCPDVARYTEWVRGWLWAQGLNNDLVLVGYTLGASIALQYGLDYPDEVRGLVIMTVAARPKVPAPGKIFDGPVTVEKLCGRDRADAGDSRVAIRSVTDQREKVGNQLRRDAEFLADAIGVQHFVASAIHLHDPFLQHTLA